MDYILEELNDENILESLYRNINDFILIMKNSATFFSGTIVKLDSEVKEYSILKTLKYQFDELKLFKKYARKLKCDEQYFKDL